MAMTQIGTFSLYNDGGLIVRGQVSWIDENGKHQLTSATGDVTIRATSAVDPGELGVPDGSIVSLYVFVIWGHDNEARQSFLYQKGNSAVAKYAITGTTLSNTLSLISTD